MKVIKFPDKKNWQTLLARPVQNKLKIESTVQKIIDGVRANGDSAVREFTMQFDGVHLNDFLVGDKEIGLAVSQVSNELKNAIGVAMGNIERFHQSQIYHEQVVETMPGIKCWRKSIAIESVGLYVPGGTAPLFSTVLMLAIPARLAGCRDIVLCTPPGKDQNVHPAILYCARQAGVTRIFKIGGAQAIAALSFGTESMPKVAKIFGPGNRYVTCAKQLVQKDGIAIDMPAGPSELAVFADSSANASFVASDLLSQAEHGVDSQVLLITNDEDLMSRVQSQIDEQLSQLVRKEIVIGCLENSVMILVKNEREALDLINVYAPEHLIIASQNALKLSEGVQNAGSVFIGDYSPESAGDYASGTNHTLPTNGYAKAYSGVSIDSFVKKVTFQHLSKEGLQNIGPTVEVMAEAEGLQAHANAIRIRRHDL